MAPKSQAKAKAKAKAQAEAKAKAKAKAKTKAKAMPQYKVYIVAPSGRWRLTNIAGLSLEAFCQCWLDDHAQPSHWRLEVRVLPGPSLMLRPGLVSEQVAERAYLSIDAYEY